MTMKETQRLLRHVVIEEPGGCWLWRGNETKRGYPRIWFRGKPSQAAHRVAYELFVAPVSPSIDLHHRCHTSACVNPIHLVPVNRVEHRSEHLVTACPRGHAYTPENTLLVSQGRHKRKKRRCRTCTRDYMAEYHRNRRH